MTTAWVNELLYECVARVCITFGTMFLVIAFYMAIGFLMGAMTASFALLFDLYKRLWNSENGQLTKIFLKDTK